MKTCLTPASFMAAALLAISLSGCNSVKVWPFKDSKPSASPRTPANATEYQCDSGKRFYVRSIDNGNAIWLIYPDREVALSKTAGGSGTRYTNGVDVLDIQGNEATLADGAAISYSGCKASAKK